MNDNKRYRLTACDAEVRYTDNKKPPFWSRVAFLLFLPIIRDASSDSPCNRIPMRRQQSHVVAIDKSHLDEHGGHGGIS